jgi:hypothetical protein
MDVNRQAEVTGEHAAAWKLKDGVKLADSIDDLKERTSS